MTDAGGLLPEPDTAAASERAVLLRRIARALNLPVSSFGPGEAAGRPAGAASQAECAAALSAFARIRDPAMRRHCLQMLERCADP